MFFSVRTRILAAFLLVIGLSFYLAAMSTIRLVSASLFEETIRKNIASATDLAVYIGEERAGMSAEQFGRLLQTRAAEFGGRLLVTDTDGKVQADSFEQAQGMRLMFDEVYTVLGGERQNDHGFHRRSTLYADHGENLREEWLGCFTVMITENNRCAGTLVLLISVEETVDSLQNLCVRMAGIFAVALFCVLFSAGVISRIITQPVTELSAGIERMSRGDYRHKVHVPGRSEMAQLAEAFNQMSEQVHRLDEARNQFVSNASHELKTPLATIKILVESMIYQDDMDEELRHEFLNDINKEIDRLSSVVGDLLTLVHIDSHKLRLRREMMLLSDTVRDTADRLMPLAAKRGQQMEMRIEDGCEMFADPGKLAQVCYNIIENAIKYTPDGGVIHIRLTRSGRDAVLEIEDNGVGIPQEDLPHVFERFYRVDKARSRETGGTGLGLSIVQQIVRLHAGSVTVESTQGKGTVFTVQLPVK